jgi:hypothetical protein
MVERHKELQDQLIASWSSQTASTWTSDSPASGQCSVTALVVQDLLGGRIFKTRVGSCWHFYNEVAGRRLDLTESQFATPVHYDDLPATREETLRDTSLEQYRALRRALKLDQS